MRRLLAGLLLICLLPVCPALADPLPLLEDYTESAVLPFDEEDPSSGQFVFTCRYPHADPDAPGGELVNHFYETKLRELRDFYIDHDFDTYQDECLNCTIESTYEVTCNNDAYFSVLIRKKVTTDDEEYESWTGHTFDRTNGLLNLSASLPVLLGRLTSGESDSWLEERESGKVSGAVISLSLDAVRRNPEGIPYRSGLTKELLARCINPDEDFFLDETGNPVFFIFPGYIADPEEGYMTFSFSFRDIRDEM